MNRYIPTKKSIEWLPNGWRKGMIKYKKSPNPDTIRKDTSTWPNIVEIIESGEDGEVLCNVISPISKDQIAFAQGLLEFYYE